MLNDNKKVNWTTKNASTTIPPIKIIVLCTFFSISAMVMIAAIVFSITITPIDETIVPRVVEKNITEAMLLIQENNLITRINTQFHDTAPLGTVLQQSPSSGLRVKMDGVVELIVSQGIAINRVENFEKMSLADVKIRITTIYRELLSLKEPIIYVYSDQEAGTIIAQKPEPGVTLVGPTQLELMVSRGPSAVNLPTSSYLGLSYEQALRLLGEASLPFKFIVSTEIRGNGLILAQEPQAGELFIPGQSIVLTMAKPENVAASQKLALYSFSVLNSPTPLNVRVLLRRDGALDTELFKSKLTNVEIIMPYIAAVGNRMVLEIEGRETNVSVIE